MHELYMEDAGVTTAPEQIISWWSMLPFLDLYISPNKE